MCVAQVTDFGDHALLARVGLDVLAVRAETESEPDISDALTAWAWPPSPKKRLNRSSQANGALMRVSPLGIFAVSLSPMELAAWARTDASLTHPHTVCQESSVVFTAAIAFAIRSGGPPKRIHHHALETLLRAGNSAAVARLHSRLPATKGTQGRATAPTAGVLASRCLGVGGTNARKGGGLPGLGMLTSP
jgi:ADP-ribosylglycohydrolase